ncbi:MAG TPA: ricin-type beta-trefoil lectin domain protein [Candidatus Saccharimonadales bacterium]
MKIRRYFSKEWTRAHAPLLAMVVSFALIGLATTWYTHADASNVSVNFNSTTVVLPPDPIGVDVSTYGSNNITASSAQVSALKTLGTQFVKIPIQWNNGSPVSSASGGPKNITASQWITAAKATGAVPEIVVGGTSDDNFTASDAANLVKYFNTPGTSTYNPIQYWAIGNEPSDQTAYCTLFNASAVAMKAVDPTIKIDGPTYSFYSQDSMQKFLTCAGNNVDIVDFHAYGTGNNPLDTATLLSQTSYDGNFLKQLRQMINTTDPSRASQIQMQVGEYNMSYVFNDGYSGGWAGSGNDSRMLEPINTVWSASTLGSILAGGGRGMQYGDSNGGLSLTFDGSLNSVAASHYGLSSIATSSPMPIYHGIGMFTGESLFRGFGTNVVSSSTTLPNVDVFASSNNDEIVLVNKNPSTTENATIALTGFNGGSADVWQTSNTNPYANPTKVSTTNVTDSMSVSLPAYTVTTIVLNGGSTTTTTSAPTISSVASGTPSTSGATVTWTTDQSSTSQVQYGTSTSYGSTTAEDASMATSHSVTVSGLAAGTTYHYRVISTNNNGQTTSSSDYTFTTAAASTTPTPPTPPTATTLGVPFRINVGGATYKDASGNSWLADTDFTGGATDNQGAGKAITGTSAQAIYQDERYGTSFSYALPVANGTYKLQLDFAEIYPGCSKAGCRVFNVAVNGSAWLSKFDIAAKVGSYAALTESENVTVTSGKINLSFTGVTGSAQLAGIEVTAPSTTSTPTPPVSTSVSGAIVGIANMCLDNKLSNFQNGNAIQLYACNKTAAQTWTIPGDGTIRLDNNKFCLDVQNAGTLPGTPAQLYSCNGTAAQQWVINSNGSISNPHSGLCLDDEHSGTSNGNPIWLYTCNGTNAQKWTVPKS